MDYLVAGEYDRLAAMASPTLSYTHSNAALDSKDGFLGDLRSGRVKYGSMQHRRTTAVYTLGRIGCDITKE